MHAARISRTTGIIVVLFCAVISITESGALMAADKIDGRPCQSALFCHGDFLKKVHKLFDSSKDFVDRPAKNDPEFILKEFENLDKKSPAKIEEFIGKYFDEVRSDLVDWQPEDLQSAHEIPFFKTIEDRNLRFWAEEIHRKWGEFGRKEAPVVKEYPARTSLIHMPHPFIINGFAIGKNTGRFREQRYWDAYFTIHGLLISGLNQTAKGMIVNFGELVNKFGFVPIGNRVYFQTRPQMPLLSALVQLYYLHNNQDGEELMRQMLPLMVQEYAYWVSKSVEISVDGKVYEVNRYTSNNKMPRPESYREDFDTARTALHTNGKHSRTRSLQGAEESLYSSLSAASASGWEFSSRWLDSANGSLADIRTETIIPVDLNAALCQTERHLSEFHKIIGKSREADDFLQKSIVRGDAIQAVFWNDSLNMWRDYDIGQRKHRENFYLSDLSPLFAMCSPRKTNLMSGEILRKILASNDALDFSRGLPVSFQESQATCSSCRWDFPNIWPSMQLQLVEVLAKNSETNSAALAIAQKLISTMYDGYVQSESIFETYSVKPGQVYGTNGEYQTHQGYAPSNGVVLRLLELFPNLLRDLQNNEIVYEKTELSTGESSSQSVVFVPDVEYSPPVFLPDEKEETKPHRTRQEPTSRNGDLSSPSLVTSAPTAAEHRVADVNFGQRLNCCCCWELLVFGIFLGILVI